MTKISSVQLLFLLIGCFLLNACSSSSPKITPEEEIRLWIEQAIESAENRDSKTITSKIHVDYEDRRKYTQKSLSQLIQLYFFRHKNIHLFHKIESIEIIGSNDALVSLHVAMTGSDINSVSMLSGLRAKIYSIELDLIKLEDWQVVKAKWTPASTSDIK